MVKRYLIWHLKQVLAGLVIAYLLVALFVYWRQDAMVFQPPKSEILAPAGYGLIGTQERIITGKAGNLRGWHHPAAEGELTIILFHGNGANLALLAPKLKALNEAGFGTLLVSYRGYSGNPGKPSEQALMQDAAAILEAAKNKLRISPAQTILYGESLGTSIAVRMATRGNYKAVILDAPYTSVTERAQEIFFWLPVKYMINNGFPSAQYLSRVDEPLLILHGTADQIIPIHHGKAMFAAANEPKHAVWMQGETHYMPPARIATEIQSFLKNLP